MINWRNKYVLSVVFLAAALFLGVSIAGEYLHQRIHHHESQSSHDDCVMYQLQVQAFLACAVYLLGSRLSFIDSFSKSNTVVICSAFYSLDRGRSPPFSV